MYRMSPEELTELARQVTEYLEQGWIRPGQNPWASPVLFSRKANGALRMCLDYRAVNKYTKRIHFPIPSVETILDSLGGSVVFSALDLTHGYHQLRMDESYIPYTAFQTHLGQFEFCVLPFGLSSAPSTYQRFINDVLKPWLRPYVSVYLDDVLVHSKDLESHVGHLREVLKLLSDAGLRIRLQKCHLASNTLDYLGHRISASGLEPSPKKTEAVQNWPIPNSVKAVQSFLGFCNFYRRYVKHYSDIASPLYDLTKLNPKDKFTWTPECAKAFQDLKYALTHAPVLASPRVGQNESFVLVSDASDRALGAVLLQYDITGKNLHPVSYFAKTLNSAQRDYPVYDKELLGICSAIHEYRVYLEGCKNITVITDHQTLQHLLTQKTSSRRHNGWIQTLTPYASYLEIVYKKGDTNQADPLSRRPDLMQTLQGLTENPYDPTSSLAKDVSKFIENDFEREVNSYNHTLGSMIHLTTDTTIIDQIKHGYEHDPYLKAAFVPAGITYDHTIGL